MDLSSGMRLPMVCLLHTLLSPGTRSVVPYRDSMLQYSTVQCTVVPYRDSMLQYSTVQYSVQ